MFRYFTVHKGKEVKDQLDNVMNKSPKKLLKKMKVEKIGKYKLYVYRFLTCGSLRDAKPCAECTRWIYMANSIGVHYEVYYTDDDETIKSYTDFDSTHHYIPKNTYFNI